MKKSRLDEEQRTKAGSDAEPAEATSPIAGESGGGPAEGTTPPAAPAPVPAESPIDYRDRWLRAEADFQNFRRRAQRDLEEGVRFAEERWALDVIAMLDDLERGLDAAREQGGPESWVQGMQLVASRARDLLARHRVTPMDPIGTPFDPERHEAMLEIEAGDAAPGSVVQVVRRGYQRDGRALRPARVVVARRAED